jgi:hypothetical protein
MLRDDALKGKVIVVTGGGREEQWPSIFSNLVQK